MEWNLLVHNGVLQPHDPGSAVLFLRSQPPGAYTTTRSAGNAAFLLLWDRHLARLAQSVHLLLSIDSSPLVSARYSVSSSCDSCLKALLQPSMEVGLQKAMEVRRDEEELVVTAYVKLQREKLDAYVHISRFVSDRMGTIPASAHVAIMGPGRSFPNAKSSQWVSCRQALEQVRPPDVTEILLSNDGNALLEGTITNLFVVCSSESDLKGKGYNGEIDMEMPWKGLEIHTAPLGGVLPGVIRQIILEICDEQGIPLREIEPLWSNYNLWKEAFLTNSVRLLQPVESIQAPIKWPSGWCSRHWQNIPWVYLHLEGLGNVTQAVQQQVWQKALSESVPIQSFLKEN